MKFRNTIRIPLLFTIVLVLAFILLGWNANQKENDLQAHQKLLRQQLTEQNQNPDNPAPLSKRITPKAPDESLNRIARDFISVGSDFKHIFREHSLLQLDLEDRNRIINAIEGVMSLSQEELKELLNLIKEEPGLHYQAHEKLLTFVMARWGTINPGKMLNHLAAWPDAQELLRSSYRTVIRNTLGTWIHKNPDEVLKWMKKSHHSLSDNIAVSAIRQFAPKIVQTDPLQTFDFISEFSEEPHAWFPNILQSCNLTSDERVQAISRVSEMAGELKDPVAAKAFIAKNLRAFVLSQKSHEADFQTAIDTIKGANLQLEDYEFIWNPAKDDLGHLIKNEETGKWILWLRDHVPAEKSRRRIKQLLERWNKWDEQAAAQFIRENRLE